MGRERTGGIISRKGALYARVSYVDATGRRREVTRKALDRADARRIIDELHARLDSHGGEAMLNDRSPFADVIELYREEKAQPAVIRDGKKISGLKSHYTFGLRLDVLKAHFGAKKLRDIRPADLHRFKKERLATPTQYGRPRSVADVNRELEAMRAVCRWCVAQGWISRSPFELGEPAINKSHEGARDRVLSHAEETALLDACTGKRAFLRAVVVMALDTAARRGEIFKLRWANVNLAQGVINLPGEITKTGKPRTVPLTPRVIAELEAIRPNVSPDTFDEIKDLVFSVVNFRHSWEVAIEDAKLRDFHFHDLRHSSITRMIAAGIESSLVMKISGHDSMKSFQRYLNPENHTLRDVASKLHDLNVGEWGKSEGEAGPGGYVN